MGRQTGRSLSFAPLKPHYLLFFVVSLIAPELAFAAGGASLFTFWSNFIVFTAVISYLLVPPFKKFWRSRCTTIHDLKHAGKRELAEAEELLSKAKHQMASLSEDIEEAQKDILRSAEGESAQLIQDAKEKATRTKEHANASIEGERRTAEQSIKQELAALVIEKASKKLSDEVTEDVDKQLRENAMQGFRSLINQ